ncbi:hypothetical protein HYDPIDRAFT_98640 [Hydnomerulius pinastri MD-312]|uniref:Unplaced genomic scaffold scaffold_38, whole genome shotgun sequence n=1 Tax=Hydnomerulius pinastri MD-312 TaxID=994086 RepID=A0A0C9WAC9_9AGAM|nr:hypothetical protein HYDPIDRAFT_98640 [Hydnomerulius pinastri MD-312]
MLSNHGPCQRRQCVLVYIEEITNCGFPFSHQQLCKHVNEILTACLQPTFLGPGKCWSEHFVAKHSDHLKILWKLNL